jgi:hypothetical protein
LLIFKAFEYYEASAISYIGLVSKTDDYARAMNERRSRLIEKFENDPILFHPLKPDRFRDLLWSPQQ